MKERRRGTQSAAKDRILTPSVLMKECGNGAYQRGREYFEQGMLNSLNIEGDGDLVIINSTTRSSGQHIYEQQVEINWSWGKANIEGSCSCPVGYNCKHVVAACLAYNQQFKSSNVSSEVDAFSRWLTKLSATPSAPSHPHEANPEFLLYALQPSVHGNDVRIELFVVKMKRDETPSKGRRTSLSSIDSSYALPNYLHPGDDEILALLKAADPTAWSGQALRGMAGATALGMIIDSGRAYWKNDRQRPLRRGDNRQTALGWQEHNGVYKLQVSISPEALIVPVSPPAYLDPENHECGVLILPPGVDAKQLQTLHDAPAVPLKQADKISHLLARQFPALPTPTPIAITELKGIAPTPKLTLHHEGGDPLKSSGKLNFLYDGCAIDMTLETPIQTQDRGDEIVHIHRDLSAEAAAVERLHGEGFVEAKKLPMQFTMQTEQTSHQARIAAWFHFVEECIPQLQAEGWLIEQADETALTLSHAENIEAEVDSPNNDWFELRFDIYVDGKKLPLLPLISELLGDYRPGTLPSTLYLPYEEGHYVEVQSAQIEPILQNIIELFDSFGGGEELRLSRLDAPRLLELGETPINGGATLQKLAKKLNDFSGIKAVKLPSTFKGELREYQQQGVNWLQFLREYGLAGILADDMGLGKTVQTLAHLAIEKKAGRMKRPSLIIAPTSLMGNWRREAEQFTPGLRVLVLHGSERHQYFNSLHDYDLILTTYPLLSRDSEVLQALDYHYLILDEAQVIKNHRSQASQLVRVIKANHRLSLTGTPMENHLGELWAQFDFLLPGFLGTQKQFVNNYRSPIEKRGDSEKLRRLTQRTAPFMLRRNKDMVATELPAKSEFIRTVPIEGKQATLYESIRLTMEKKVREAITKQGLGRSHITILDALLKLRQVCCDPRLLPNNKGDHVGQSAKFEMLMEMIPELLDEGRRVLLFSQFTTMLGLIEDGLKERGIRYSKLTGQTRKRDAAIDSFRSGEVDLFLISLKAGGVGLNLTEADTVIHYDPWWNPAAEAQATDRAHRIGQDKPVFVYKLLTEGTVEEKILAMQERKQKLADSVYSNGQKEGELLLNNDTISELFSQD